MDLAKKVVDKMISGDAFSKWLGIDVLEVSEDLCKVKMQVRKEMTNGFDIAHGGITYSLADSCLAFAANSYGIQALTLETSINYSNSIFCRTIILYSGFSYSGRGLSISQIDHYFCCFMRYFSIKLSNWKVLYVGDSILLVN